MEVKVCKSAYNMYRKNKINKINIVMWSVIISLILYIGVKLFIMSGSEDIRRYGFISLREEVSDMVTKAVLSEIMPGVQTAYIGEIITLDEIQKSDDECNRFLLESFNSIYAANDDSTENTDIIENDENELNSLGDIARGDAIGQDTTTKSEAAASQTIEKLISSNSYEYLINHFYTIDSTTSTPSYLKNPSKLINKNMKLKSNIDKPQVLIYHTHASEAYSDSRKNNKSDTIVGVGDELTIELEKLGIQVLHNRASYDVIDGRWNRYSYDTALPEIKNILNENKSIEVVIDLHRDSGDKKEVTTIDGKKTARIMFFNGVSRSRTASRDNLVNNNLQGNLAFSLQLKIEAMKSFNDFAKKIYLKGYRYNLHLVEKSTLIEVGNDKNTVNEAKNAMKPLARVIEAVVK